MADIDLVLTVAEIGDNVAAATLENEEAVARIAGATPQAAAVRIRSYLLK